MALELVYTSVPKGLRPGSYGFCTVACTRGMQERTISTLEKISAYRRVNPTGGTGANPVVYSYLMVEEGGVAARVLSRIGDAGLDYTNRDNKIACHYVLDRADYGAAGPAALFSARGLFPERWTAAPQWFETQTAFPSMPAEALTCNEWLRAARDPGWAGALASTALTGQNALIVVEPDCNALRLFQESISLLPAQYRWNATFSTYYTKTLSSVRCQWKCVLKGSPEENAFRALPNMLVVDLSNPAALPRLETTPFYANAARLVASARAMGAAPQSTPSVAAQVAASRRETQVGTQTTEETYAVDSSGYYDLAPQNDANYSAQNDLPLNASSVAATEGNKRERSRKYVSTGVEVERVVDVRSGAKINPLLRFTIWGTLGGIVAAVLTCVILSAIGMSPLKGVKNLFQYRKELMEAAQDGDATPGPKESSNAQNAADDEDEEDLFNFGPAAEEEKKQSERKTEPKKQTKKPSKPMFAADPEEDRVNRPFDGIPEGGLGAGTSRSDEDSEDESDSEPIMKGRGNDERNETGSSRTLNELEAIESSRVKNFVKLFNAGGMSVDFECFASSGEPLLREDIIGETQRDLKQVVAICKKYRGTIEITCDITSDSSEKWSFVNDSARKMFRKASFNDDSEPINIKFDVAPNFSSGKIKKGKQGTLTIELGASNEAAGLCSIEASDETTRDYFLAAAKFQWRVILPQDVSKEEFVTDFVQLLKPYKFENNRNVNLKSFNELSSTLGEQSPQTTIASNLASVKKETALLIEYDDSVSPMVPQTNAARPVASIDGANVDFKFVARTSDRKNREFMTIRFEKSTNGNVLRNEVKYDEDELRNKLEDEFSNQKPKGNYHSYGSRNDVQDPDEYVQSRVEETMLEIENELDKDRTFKFYLTSPKLDSSGNRSQILWGETSLNPSRDSSSARRKRS